MKENPSKEFYRVMNIVSSRGDFGVKPKFAMMAKLVKYLLRIKEFKALVLRFFELVDIEKLWLDSSDDYRCLMWSNYQFNGLSGEERASIRMMIDSSWARKLKENNMTQVQWAEKFIEENDERSNDIINP